MATLRAQAAAITAHWQSEKDAISLIRQIKAELALKKADTARCEREGDLARAADIRDGPVAELELSLDAAAKPALPAGLRMEQRGLQPQPADHLMVGATERSFGAAPTATATE